jgi:hypothetical protein
VPEADAGFAELPAKVDNAALALAREVDEALLDVLHLAAERDDLFEQAIGLAAKPLKALLEVAQLSRLTLPVRARLVLETTKGFAKRLGGFAKPLEPPELLVEQRKKRVRLIKGEEARHASYQERVAP